MNNTIYPHQHLVDRACRIEPEFRFDARWVDRPEVWAERWSAKLLELMGPWPEPVDPQARWELLEDRGDHVLHRVRYRTEPGLETFALVAVPTGAASPIPAVLCLHGHGPFGAYPVVGYGDEPGLAENIAKHRYDFGRRLAQAGAVAFCPNLRGFGERLTEQQRQINGQAQPTPGRRDTCNLDFFQRLWLGEVAITGQLHELKAALGVLASMEAVDPEAIGCAGLSYGGRLTTFLAAIEPRIRAAVISGAMSTVPDLIGRSASCGQQVVPGMLRWGDFVEVMGLTAPRSLAIEHGSQDRVCPDTTAHAEFRRLEAVYQARGCRDRLAWLGFDGGHLFHGDRSIPWLIDQLTADRVTKEQA